MSESKGRTSWTRPLFLLLSAAAAVAVVLAAREVLLPFVLALVIAYVLTPFVAWFERKGLRRSVAIVAAYAVVLGSLAGFLWAIAPRIGAYHAALADLKRLVANGPVEGWPGREGDQRLLKGLAACRFEAGATYTEKQASDLLRGWLAGFCAPGGLDHVTMRRELVDAGLLVRDKAGASYTVNPARIADFVADDARWLDPASVREAVRRERESRKRDRAG